ncbi:MAG: mannonate dehydratase [Candidatus Latescibacteria bacterium]|jgi:mannonate dehydratase|nr:mannonate dehydratase [Candidatus Latescibacterota bacterium]
MYIQDQLPHNRITPENLAYYKAIGVDYLTINSLPLDLQSYGAMVEFLGGARALAEQHGLRLYNAAMSGPDEITLALPGRDAKIAEWCDWIRAMGKVGIPTLGYNFKPVGNFRTPADTGRGQAKYSTFVYAEYERQNHADRAKPIAEDAMWANIDYFHQRIVPVAAEAGVTLALHPDDPPLPEPMAGAARIVSTLEQYERIFALNPSPNNAMLFCQGCVTEMGIDVCEAIRRMGGQDKICYVHFRNVRGTPKDFREVFIDEGDVDMFRAMQTYKEAGFAGPFMMDHTPSIPDDRDQRQGHAYATGYIRAMIQAIYR